MSVLWSTGPRRLLLVLALAGLDVAGWSALGGLRSLPAAYDLSDLVVVLCAWAVTLGLGWLTLLAGLVALEPVTGRDLAAAVGCPPALRRVLLALCGVAALGPLAAPVQAASPADAPQAMPGASRVASDGGSGLDGLPLPDRATGPARRPGAAGTSASSGSATASPSAAPSARPSAHPSTRPSPAPTSRSTHPPRTSNPTTSGPGSTTGSTTSTGSGPSSAHRPAPPSQVVVQRGQCLWDVARDRLVAVGVTPSDAAVDRTWRALYAANRDAIGPDPDVVHPGTRLRVPDPLPPAKETDR